MRAFLLGAFVLCAVALGLLACNPNSIGRPCVNPAGNTSLGTKVVSPALECPSRLCLLTDPFIGGADDGGAGGTDVEQRAICTAGCESDDDCEPETSSKCPSKRFVCAIATDVTVHCCKKYCICYDDLEEGKNKDADGGVVVPESCNTLKNPNATCKNARPYQPGQR